MANTLTAVTPKLLAQGLMALREMAITPQLVNRRYEELAGEKGSTIDVPIPSAIAIQAVTPAATPPSTADIAPTSVPVTLDQWFEAPFYLTDKDMKEAMNGTIPMQASEAVKAVANKIDQTVLDEYKKFYGFHGRLNAAGSAFLTPFEDENGDPIGTKDATSVRTILNQQLSPLDDRHVVLDPTAEGAALNVRAFQDASFGGGVQTLLQGQLNQKLGYRWWMDQNVRTHTAGTASDGATTVAVDNGAGYAIGIKALNVDVAAGTKTLVEGDIITFAGHSQSYVVTAAATLDTTGVTVNIEPGLQSAVVDDEVITVKKSHVVNLAFHRDAIALATRPFAPIDPALGSIMSSTVDPISGLALRLEVTREHKRVRFSYDALWGVKTVRREFGCRLAGAA